MKLFVRDSRRNTLHPVSGQVNEVVSDTVLYIPIEEMGKRYLVRYGLINSFHGGTVCEKQNVYRNCEVCPSFAIYPKGDEPCHTYSCPVPFETTTDPWGHMHQWLGLMPYDSLPKGVTVEGVD